MGKSNRFGFCDISLWFSSYIICVMVWRKSHRFSFSEICVMALVKYVLTWPFWKFVWWHQKNHTIFFSWTDLCDLKPLITHVTGTGGPKSHGCCIDRPFFWNRRGKSPTDVCVYVYSIPRGKSILFHTQAGSNSARRAHGPSPTPTRVPSDLLGAPSRFSPVPGFFPMSGFLSLGPPSVTYFNSPCGFTVDTVLQLENRNLLVAFLIIKQTAHSD
jgi:hypothetical protein